MARHGHPAYDGAMTDRTTTAGDAAGLTLDELRPRLVEAMLPHVPFDGWSRKAAQAAAADLGLAPPITALAFPGGGIDMVAAYVALADERMLRALDGGAYRALKVRARIAAAIRSRLEAAAADREAVRRAMALLALPQHAPRAARLAWRTADAIWFAAGDTATDFNHYTKRALAAAVYTSTLLFWLQDDSEDFAATRAFLDRRIDGVMRFERLKAKFRPGNDTDDGARPSLVRFLGRLRYRAAQEN